MKKITLFSSMLFLIAFTACNETKKVVEVTENIHLTGNYTTTSINGYLIKEVKLPTISFNALDNSIKGNSSCNGYFGKYTIDIFTINIGPISSTEMYCSEPIMEVERAFFKALSETGSFSLENNILTLYSKTNRTVLLKANKDKIE